MINKEIVNWNPKWILEKFNNKNDYKKGVSYFRKEFKGNLLTNVGINEMAKLIAGTGAVKYDNANAFLAVGTSSTVASATNTSLTNEVRKAMDIGFPTNGASQQITWRSTFGIADANQAWNEFGVYNHASAGVLLNRKVSGQGIKVAGQIWQLTLEITFS